MQVPILRIRGFISIIASTYYTITPMSYILNKRLCIFIAYNKYQELFALSCCHCHMLNSVAMKSMSVGGLIVIWPLALNFPSPPLHHGNTDHKGQTDSEVVLNVGLYAGVFWSESCLMDIGGEGLLLTACQSKQHLTAILQWYWGADSLITEGAMVSLLLTFLRLGIH